MERDIRLLGHWPRGHDLTALAGQAPPTKTRSRPAEQIDPKACAQDRATVGQGGDIDVRQPRDRNLSDRLARTDGVICPPSQVDPEIHAPTPPGGAMPVIPPPGSPGGDQSIQPK